MPKFISKSTVTTMMFCLAYAALAGCGTKGPLYLPEQRYPQKVDGQKDDVQQENTQKSPQNPNPEVTTPTKEY